MLKQKNCKCILANKVQLKEHRKKFHHRVKDECQNIVNFISILIFFYPLSEPWNIEFQNVLIFIITLFLLYTPNLQLYPENNSNHEFILIELINDVDKEESEND